MIFSDLPQTLGTHQIGDVLDGLPTDVMKNNSEFDLYHRQQLLMSQGREIEISALRDLPQPKQVIR